MKDKDKKPLEQGESSKPKPPGKQTARIRGKRPEVFEWLQDLDWADLLSAPPSDEEVSYFAEEIGYLNSARVEKEILEEKPKLPPSPFYTPGQSSSPTYTPGQISSSIPKKVPKAIEIIEISDDSESEEDPEENPEEELPPLSPNIGRGHREGPLRNIDLNMEPEEEPMDYEVGGEEMMGEGENEEHDVMEDEDEVEGEGNDEWEDEDDAGYEINEDGNYEGGGGEEEEEEMENEEVGTASPTSTITTV